MPSFISCRPSEPRPGPGNPVPDREKVRSPWSVLVTAGAGYLGSQLIRELPKMPASRGEAIRVLDNLLRERNVTTWNPPKGVRVETTGGVDATAVAPKLLSHLSRIL